MNPRRLNTRRIVKSFYRSWWRRPFWLVVTFVVVPLLVGRVALNPLLEKAVRRHLEGLSGTATATFSDLDVFLFPPSFTFRDVVVRGPSGETLETDRLEIHLGKLQELRGAAPHMRVRLVHPQLRIVPGAGDLERWVNALPPAQVEVTSVENGSIGSVGPGSGGAIDRRSILGAIKGDIEGLVTGGAAGRPTGGTGRGAPWQAWLDARLDGTDPLHLFIKVDAAAAWEATLTVQQVDSGAGASPPSGSGPVALDARARGTGTQARVAVAVSWPGTEAPVTLAQERLNRLSARWPASEMTVVQTRAAAGRLELTLATTPDGSPLAAAVFPPFEAVGLVANVLRLSNQALLPPPPDAGMAALQGPQPDPQARREAEVNVDAR
ncbi:MAG: hypothetical protein ABJA82_00340 [Myxococcales bacterium]